MILTVKPSLQNGHPSPHAYSSPQPLSSSSTKPSAPTGAAGGTLPPLPDGRPRRMSTPHRGLPPPLGMSLPNPERTQPPSSLSQPMGNLPAPPSQWQGGADDSMRNWLAAKAEEDKRKQEEEKTRQETLRLEQRRIEQNMLRESLQGGVPPQLVPMVFAGIGGGGATSASVEWAQHYMAQITLQQQQQQHVQQQSQQQSLPPAQGSPENPRDRPTGPQPNPYSSQQPPSAAGALVPQQSPQVSNFQSSFQVPTANRLPQGNQGVPGPPPRIPGQSNLPILNTNEMQIQAPPQAGVQLPGHHHLQQQAPTQQQEQQSNSPSIYFHHWVPPTSQKDPPTSGSKSQQNSPYSQNASSHLRSEYVNSPKKRKTTSSHHSGPSQKTPDTSPSISQLASSGRRRALSNQQSDTSSRGTHEATGLSTSRPASRAQQHRSPDAESSNQAQGPHTQDETAQFRDTGSERKRTGSGTPKGGAENP